MRNVSDGVDFKCMCDRQLCLLTEVCATSDGIDQDRSVPQEGRGYKDLSEFRVNAIRHVLFSELEEVIHQLEGIYGRGFDWVDESEKCLEDFCGLYDMDDGKGGILRSMARWLRDGEYVVEEG